jgi:hypothetical protein
VIARLAVVAVLLSSCASAWPSSCRDTLAGIQCSCQRVAIRILPLPGAVVTEAVGTTPARRPGRLAISCDDAILPVQIDAQHVGRGGEP